MRYLRALNNTFGAVHQIIKVGWELCPGSVAHLGVGPRVREGRTHTPRRPVKDCEPSLCRDLNQPGDRLVKTFTN